MKTLDNLIAQCINNPASFTLSYDILFHWSISRVGGNMSLMLTDKQGEWLLAYLKKQGNNLNNKLPLP